MKIGMELTTKRILIAEDDKDISQIYKMALKDIGYKVKLVDNGEDCVKVYLDNFQELRLLKSKEIAVDKYKNQPFEVVLLDYKMPKRDGLQVAKEVLAVNPHQRIIFASAYITETLMDSVKELKQVVEFLQKPFSLHTLLDTIKDKQVYEQLKRYRLDTALLEKAELNHEQLRELLNILKRVRST